MFKQIKQPGFISWLKILPEMKVLLFLFIPLFLVSCVAENEEDLYPPQQADSTACDSSDVSFMNEVAPILSNNCATAGCHNENSMSFGYGFYNYKSTKASFERGRVLGAIQHDPGYSAMPKGGPKLPDCDLALIRNWVGEGLKNN